MRLLWDLGPRTVRELLEEFERRDKDWAYTTVQTLLVRLRDKGYVESHERGLAHVFNAAVSRETLVDWRMKELAAQVGADSRSALVHQLVQSGGLTAKELADLRRLIDEATPARRRAKRRPGRKD